MEIPRASSSRNIFLYSVKGLTVNASIYAIAQTKVKYKEFVISTGLIKSQVRKDDFRMSDTHYLTITYCNAGII